jgi:hypothetical protein
VHPIMNLPGSLQTYGKPSDVIILVRFAAWSVNTVAAKAAAFHRMSHGRRFPLLAQTAYNIAIDPRQLPRTYLPRQLWALDAAFREAGHGGSPSRSAMWRGWMCGRTRARAASTTAQGARQSLAETGRQGVSRARGAAQEGERGGELDLVDDEGAERAAFGEEE